jgi:SAM-dependent methyltransferase
MAMLNVLPPTIPAKSGRPDIGGADHPMRRVTREIATEPDGWTPRRAAEVKEVFAALAPLWSTRDIPERHDALRDALGRGGPFPAGTCLEVGAGTGSATPDLQRAFGTVVSTDVTMDMLRHFTAATPIVLADAAHLPVPDASVAVVALVNMFLFPAEVDRVLVADGVLLWVSTNGDATPIYLPPVEVVDALPGAWSGTTADAGWGTWLTARRADVSPGGR